MKVQPLADRVLLQAYNEAEKKSSGIYLPEEANKERPYIYKVIAIGPGTSKNPMTLAIGDKVLSGQYSGDEVKVNNEEFKIVSVDYILAILK